MLPNESRLSRRGGGCDVAAENVKIVAAVEGVLGHGGLPERLFAVHEKRARAVESEVAAQHAQVRHKRVPCHVSAILRHGLQPQVGGIHQTLRATAPHEARPMGDEALTLPVEAGAGEVDRLTVQSQ